ncbi:MAG TPA: lipid-binding SYLF domain-containing protein [Candidatus Baltobacteraceae bacterium]|nr:lipid-binding SYLF domain-containing protein [Candidatus Baltobacteraceae bacterium]
MKKVAVLLAILAMAFSAAKIARADQDRTDVVERLQSAGQVLSELDNAPDKGIPDSVFKSAKCVAVLPSMIKGAFIFGGRHGRGVATCRLPDGKWSAPAFFTITGGSWGLQIGVQDTQLVIMVMTDEGMRHLLNAKFQVGGNASAAAGPVGRDAAAGTDWKLNTDFLTYSRTKGLFAGINLDGSEIERDGDSTKAMYGHDYTSSQILTGKIPVPAGAHPFLAAVRDSAARHGAESADNR